MRWRVDVDPEVGLSFVFVDEEAKRAARLDGWSVLDREDYEATRAVIPFPEWAAGALDFAIDDEPEPGGDARWTVDHLLALGIFYNAEN
jgi:hypothetical protein